MDGTRLTRGLFVLTALAALLTAATAQAQTTTVLRVKSGNTCGESCDGSSWTLAYPLLQQAILAATPAPGDTVQIWVAAGVYRPGASGFTANAFSLNTGVELYGGFAGTETALPAVRDFVANETVLSGDLDESGGYTAYDAYHVVFVVGDGVLDGFTVTGGYAAGGREGAGIYCPSGAPARAPSLRNLVVAMNKADGGGGLMSNNCNVTLSNVWFSENSAFMSGGARIVGGSVSLDDVFFVGNASDQPGGGLSVDSGAIVTGRAAFIGNTAFGGGGANCYGATLNLTHAVFQANAAAGGGGGGLRVDNCTSSVANAVFEGNSTTYVGGGVLVETGALTLTNVTVVNNVSTATSSLYPPGGGGGVALRADKTNSLTLNNSILWGNDGTGTDVANDQLGSATQPVTYNEVIIQGATPTTEISNADPLFVNLADPDGLDGELGTPDDGLTLQSTSPAIDAGDDSVISVTTDVAGQARSDGTAVDLGAYEYQSGTTALSLLHVKAGSTCGTTCDGSTWALAYPNLQEALAAASPATGDTVEIWVAKGTYKPGTLRTDSFELEAGVELYGGFAGTETTFPATRDFVTNETVLSGDLDGDGLDLDDAYQVVTVTGAGVLDGFTITGGYDEGEFGGQGGGGIHCTASAVLENLVISWNTAGEGGGLYNNGGSPTLRKVVFVENSASLGGGMVTQNGEPSFIGVRFTGNTAGQGGGLAVYNGTLALVGVAFVGNAAEEGAGAYVQGGTTTVTHSVFVGNDGEWSGAIGVSGSALVVLNGVTVSGNNATLGAGGAFLAGSGSLTANNAIFWGNGTVQIGQDDYSSGTLTKNYTLVQGGSAPDLTGDPRFADAADPEGLDGILGTADDGLRITSGSAAIDAGSNTLVPAGVTADFAGQPRFHDDSGTPDTGEGTAPVVDVGAYEFQGTTASTNNPPVISSVTNDGPIDEGSTVTVTVVATDADSTDVLQYSFDCNGDATYEVGPQAESSATCSFADNGTFTVNVKVGDGNGGEDTDSTPVTVNNVAPVVDAGSDTSILAGGTFTQSGSFTDPGDDSWSALVDWGELSPLAPMIIGEPLTLTGKTFTLSHTYAAPGTYTVRVTVTEQDIEGAWGFDEVTVTVDAVNAPPVITSVSNTGPIAEGGSATVTVVAGDTDTSDVLAYDFDCDGDGAYEVGPQAESSASCSFADNGTFTVNVAVTDGSGGLDTDSTVVTVTNVAPVVDAGADTSVVAGGTFSRSGSFTDPGNDTWTATVDWGEGAGSVALALTGKTFSLSHTYATKGVYTLQVTVTEQDAEAAVGFDQVVVTVTEAAPPENSPPVISSVSNDGPVPEGSSAKISVVASDPDVGDVLAYSFDCDGDTAYEVSPQAEASTTCAFADNGIFTVTVKVTDGNGGEDTDSTSVTVNNVVPLVSAGSDATLLVGGTFSRSGSFEDPGADAWNATVNWGEGGSDEVLSLTGKTFSLSHTYATAGAYTVRVTVADDDGGSGFDEVVVTVTDGSTYLADLRIAGVEAPETVKVGEEIDYGIVVANDGPDRCPEVVVELSLPAGTTVKAFNGSRGWTCQGADFGSVGPVLCTKDAAMRVGQETRFELEVALGPTVQAGESLTLVAGVGPLAGDPLPENNVATAVTEVVADEGKPLKPPKPPKPPKS